ncbi:MAG TPA: TAT-variant-translocated molybdopterin oxidoreductase, partial [Myxococcaceae bacterium]|nr:TAT-variant-translocated molybdopterin oxidoreductase [Myxococcaceae bacterium]
GEHGYGRTYWRSMEERLAGDAAPAGGGNEFPEGHFDVPTGFERRDFLQLMGASIALAGITACTEKPVERVLAYTRAPEGLAPGNPLHYATAYERDGIGMGLVVTSWEGRPTKVEGNPSHPGSKGATGPAEQALLLQLYDPSRARVLKERSAGRSWRSFREAMNLRAASWNADGGAGLRFLVEPSGSPTVRALRQEILQRFPQARILPYSAAPRDNVYEGTRLTFGTTLEPQLDVERADVILSFDADFLEARSESLAAARGFAARRDLKHPAGMNRLYVVEPRMSITGGMADHRLRARSSDIEGLAVAVAAELGKTVPALAGFAPPTGLPAATQAWVKAVAKDLAAHAGRSLVVVGERQTPLSHAVGHAINAGLGNVGTTVRFTEPVVDTVSGRASWQPLIEDLRAGRVDTLVISCTNPIFSAPADVGLAALLKRVPNVVYLGYYDDETGRAANWFIPRAHPFESWGDVRALDGTTSIVQPLIAPLYAGLTEIEVLEAFVDRGERKPYDAVRATWRAKGMAADFETAWETWLSSGVIPGTRSPFVSPVLRAGAVAQMAAAVKPAPAGLELNFVTDYKVFDGRFSQNAWLQELPDPVTKVVWDNVALVSEATAAKLGVKPYDPIHKQADLVTLSIDGRSVQAPVFVQPGCADDTVTVQLGYGKQIVELYFEADAPRVVGFDAGAVRTAAAPWFRTGLQLTRAGRSYPLSTTQTQNTALGRPVALMQTLEEFQKAPEAVDYRRPTTKLKGHALPTVQKPVDYSQQQYKWGMSVDMSRCTGCSACVVACQAENNIPVVGKDQMGRGRNMQWLRMDRYYSGDPANPEVVQQPMLCQHCEAAPCEYVCPVNATVHSDEGLNDMVYNRCIGTRYCSNNCPYKVRHFNYLHWTAMRSEVERMIYNPDVTVRARGVMEKCTYCVQRIERARIVSRLENRTILESELVTACQQACPTEAIVFGSLNDPKARVSQLHEDPRRFDVLHELNTRPRTAYLTKIKNPNPELA